MSVFKSMDTERSSRPSVGDGDRLLLCISRSSIHDDLIVFGIEYCLMS